MKLLKLVSLASVLGMLSTVAAAQSSCTIDEFWSWVGTSEAHAYGANFASKNVEDSSALKHRLNNGVARAGGGTIGALATAELDSSNKYQPADEFRYVETSASAFTQSQDMVVSGPQNVSTVNGLLNFKLDGVTNPDGGKLYARVTHGSTTDQLVIDVATGQPYFDPSATPGQPDYFGTHGVSNVVVTPTGNHKETVTFSDAVKLSDNNINPVGLAIQALAEAEIYPKDVYGEEPIEQTVDFLNTLSFDTSGPAITLPEGYNVNSPTFNIVNNHFAAPEPASFCALGLGSLFLLRKRRNQK